MAAVRAAVAKKNFSVYYQPKVESSSGRVVAVEALLRCHENVLASFGMDEVIDLAMEAGVMKADRPVGTPGRLQAGAALASARMALPEAAREPLRFRDGLPSNITQALANAGSTHGSWRCN
ncbi:MAG: EAL domain-containing protein [Pseudomonadota bacterium]|nr:EAL domain-containing protein [Pseudomonadota bacterium]